METLLNNEYLTVSWNRTQDLIILDWTPRTYYMDDDEFKQNLNSVSDFVQKHQIKHFLSNTIEFDYVITPDIQAWVASEFNQKLHQAGLRKMAIVMPQAYFTQTSVQQTLKEMKKQRKDGSFESLYFGDLQTAKDWLSHFMHQYV